MLVGRRRHCTKSRRWSRILRLERQQPLRVFRRRPKKWPKKWCSLPRVWRVSCRIENAFAADATYRLLTLLLAIEVALHRPVIVHDGAPGRILRVSPVGDRQNSRAENGGNCE